MDINRSIRDKARRKSPDHYKAVDGTLEQREYEPVHSHQIEEKTRARSGVVVREPQNYGKDAIQKALDIINGSDTASLGRPKTVVGANDEWFKANKQKVENVLGERICVIIKRSGHSEKPLSGHSEIQPAPPMPTVTENLVPDADFYNYHPEIDDDEPDYIPKSER